MADDPQLHPGAARRERAPGAYLRLALWQRFALAGLIAVVLLVAMVIFIDHNNTNSNPSLNETAEVRANREAEILVGRTRRPIRCVWFQASRRQPRSSGSCTRGWRRRSRAA